MCIKLCVHFLKFCVCVCVRARACFFNRDKWTGHTHTNGFMDGQTDRWVGGYVGE